jgi:hypothetical protein
MAIDAWRPTRRRALLVAAAGTLAPACSWAALKRATQAQPVFAAAWDSSDGHAVGLLAAGAQALHFAARTDVPTRAHGLCAAPGGWLIAVARRPGDWLLRWHPGKGSTQWTWAEPGRIFTGHAAFSADGRRLFTGETDIESGQGLIGVRDPHNLAKQDEWPSHGLDPHELLAEPGALWVANGGIPTWAETGRIKRELQRMDSCLARLDPVTGELTGQWRVPDRRLSLRHLVRNQGRLGIAMQAEHDDESDRDMAPLLALFDGGSLACVAAAPGERLRGYGGDIAPLGGGFVVSATRAHCAARWPEGGERPPSVGLDSAGALAEADGDVWLAGAGGCAVITAGGVRPLALPPGVRVDNHWIRWPGGWTSRRAEASQAATTGTKR